MTAAAALKPGRTHHYIPRAYVPGSSVLLLSDTSKMPCPSWSLPARKSCPFALVGPGTVCEGCYADDVGRYGMRTVKHAQAVRYAWTIEAMQTAEGTDRWVALMTSAVRAARLPYFRVHDSGDLFSPAYVEAWTAVCRALPEIRFWFPTRSWRPLMDPRMPAETKQRWALALTTLASLPNVTVRPSGLFEDQPGPRVPGLAASSMVTTTGTVPSDTYVCPASQQDGRCLDCRNCWDAPQRPTAYPKHTPGVHARVK